jgi:NAD(P)-dependent dehydrogenase (short-subunit alcohol dehydrogenase family)
MSSKIAVITGGSRGLGRSTALQLASKGVDLVLTYRARQDEAEKVVAEISAQNRRACAIKLDVGNLSEFKSFADELGQALQRVWGRDSFDFLVNNAGSGSPSTFAETSEEAFDQLCNIHLKGVFFLTQTLLPRLADGGRIVNLSSGLTRYALPGMAAYAVMKGGVEVLSRYLAKELGPRRIAVNTVAPGAIETDFNGGVVRDNPDYNRRVAEATALGRAGVPDDIGAIIASLLSDDNRWLNGQRIEATGGAYL